MDRYAVPGVCAVKQTQPLPVMTAEGESRVPAVILERVRIGEKPDYCIHGYVMCGRCKAPCYLGSETVELVSKGEAHPLCLDCAYSLRDLGVLGCADRIGQVEDHRRADGPHT